MSLGLFATMLMLGLLLGLTGGLLFEVICCQPRMHP